MMCACALLFAVVGVVLRFDDVHPVGKWRELVAAFEAEGMKASLAVPMGLVSSDQQVKFLQEAAAKGHELMDHGYDHGVYAHRCATAEEFREISALPFVAEADAQSRQVGFRFSFDRSHPGNQTILGTITNGCLEVSEADAKRMHRPDKIYVPSLDRFFAFDDPKGGKAKIRSFYVPRPVSVPDVPHGELILCHQQAFGLCDEALRFHAGLSRRAFLEKGLPVPKVWIQPGGWEPWIPVTQFRRVYVQEFGYTAADCLPGSSPTWNCDPKAQNPEIARLTIRPQAYLDSPSVTPEQLRQAIRAAQTKGRGICFLSHMRPSPKMAGGWNEWMTETKALLRWLKANEIPVLTFSEMAKELWGNASY